MMHNKIRAALTALAVVVGLVLGGCGVVEVKAVKCDIKGNSPHESKGSAGWIDAKFDFGEKNWGWGPATKIKCK